MDPETFLFPGLIFFERYLYMRRKTSDILVQMTTLALLSSLGFVIMSFVRIPYPIAPWLMIEFSDLVVLLGYAMYGFTGAVTVSVLKTLLDFAIHGIVGPFGIGNITALLTSLTFTFALFLTAKVFHLFNKGIKKRILGYALIILFESVLLTFLNVLFITPTYLTGRFTTCFDSEAVAAVIEGMKDYVQGLSYTGLIFVVYFPFNLLKGIISCLLYELVFNRLLFVILQRSPKVQKYFVGANFLKHSKENIEDKKED